MSHLYVISDLHFGHNNIHRFRKVDGIESEEQHREMIIHNWNNTVNKNDSVYILGDAAFNDVGRQSLARLRGNKVLVRGNHDKGACTDLLQYFSNIYGFLSLHGAWLSHAPIHPQELRGHVNIHGHVHGATIPDDNYINVSVENIIGMRPVRLDLLIENPKKFLVRYGK